MKSLHYFKDLFVALIVRPLLQDPFRTAVTVLGVAIGVSVFLGIQLANRQTLASFEESVALVLGRADAVIHAEGQPFDEKYFARLLALRQWVKAYPVIEGHAVEPRSHEVIEILGADLLQDSGIRDFSLKTAEQNLRGLVSLVLDPRGIILPEKFVPGENFKPGDQIDLLINGVETSFNVNAILENKGVARALNGNFALMDIAAAQAVFGKIGKLDRIDVAFLQDRDFARMRKKISATLPDYLRVDRPQRKNRQVEKMLRAFQYNLTALSFVSLLVALYLVYNMIALSVVRRRMEIGVLRALGATPVKVAAIFLLEAAVVGAAGSLLGIGLGYGLAEFSLQAVSLTVSNLYVASHASAIAFHWGQALPYFFLGVGLAVASALIPALEAACTPPTRVMRRGGYDLKVFRGSRGLNRAGGAVFALAGVCALLPAVNRFPFFGFFSVFLIILGLSLLSPSVLALVRRRLAGACKRAFRGEGLLACRNLTQNVGRNAIAVSALATAFMMIVSMSIMVHSFRETVVVWIGQTLKADLFVRPAMGSNIDYQYTLSSRRAGELADIPGVAAVDLFRAINISYQDQPATLASGDFSVVARHANLLMKDGPAANRLARRLTGQNRAIVSEAFSLKHNVGVGGTLALNTPRGKLDLEIAGVYYDYSQERGYIVIDRTTYLRYYGDPQINSFVVYLTDKSERDRVRREIVKRIGGKQKILIRGNAELKREVLRVFDKTFAITYSLEIIAVVVAVLGLLNTLVSLVIERRREIGILRFLGAFKHQVKRMILIEAGLLGLIGSALGLAAGVVVSYILIFVINKQSFGWTIQAHFPYGFIAFTTIGFWLVSCAAGLVPARAAVQQDPMAAVRAE